MKNLRYICVQPRILYYAWQVEVMINNFIKHGINPNNIDILVAWNPNDKTSTPENIEAWDKLASHYNSVRFFFYQDTRQQPIHYISSVRPNVLKQHFQAHPELKNEAIFYHDCDIVFTKKPDWSRFLNDKIWYLSNTNSYINYDYIKSKGDDVYLNMCAIVGMNETIPPLVNSNSGGAQYIMKNVDHLYWGKVERDCEELFYHITQLNNKKKAEDPNYHELQIWCADMWAVLWNGWLRGNETKVVPEMDFSWATDPIERWNKTTIFHNAGVTCGCGRQFYKAKYMDSLPYDIQQEAFKDSVCGYNYVKEIVKTAQESCLINKPKSIQTKKTFIPENYQERLNPNQYFDMGMKDEWQKEVYLKALEVFNNNNYQSVVDIGCGSAYKLLNNFPQHVKITGVEEEKTYNWLIKEYPNNNWIKYEDSLQLEHHDLLICSDVIEHIVDVVSFIEWINQQSWKTAIISTPDRSLLYDNSHIGPPANGSHVREWTFEELRSFLSQWFKIQEHIVTNKGQGTQTIILEKK